MLCGFGVRRRMLPDRGFEGETRNSQESHLTAELHVHFMMLPALGTKGAAALRRTGAAGSVRLAKICNILFFSNWRLDS